MTAITAHAPDPATTNTTVTSESTDSALSKIRESAAALLALMIAAAFMIAMGYAFYYVGDASFTQAKELIGIVTGLMGVVLGYYFQKSSSDTQIEHATKTAEDATKQAAKAAAESALTKDALKEVAAAASEETGGGGTSPSRLQKALTRAEALTR
jgi:Tfp pilus assembly protein PilO